MEQLKKKIIDNLYKSNFYEVLANIQKIETSFPNAKEILFFYYYLYDLMSWVSRHKKHKSIDNIQKNKDKYFKQILKSYQNDKSTTYFQLYLFLEKNFTTFEHYTWFRKYEKSKELLEKSLKENKYNLEAQFYMLHIDEKIEECFEFLKNNTLKIEIVQNFLNTLLFNKEYLDASQQLKQFYNLNTEQNNLYYYVQKEDYKWLYDYFNKEKEEIYKSNYISFGKVCFELGKYDEAIEYYEKQNDKTNNDIFILGECYEQQKQKDKAINCFKNYYNNFNSKFLQNGIKKLFELQAYDEIKYVLKNPNPNLYKEYKIFCEAKILNIEKKYLDSTNLLDNIKDDSNSYDKELKKDIYFLYVLNNYELTRDSIIKSYHRILKEEDFEINNIFGLNYTILLSFQEMQKYIKKLNIEYNNKFTKETHSYRNKLHELYIEKIKKIYNKAKETNIVLTEDRELYYLSAFEDIDSLKKRIEIYKKRIEVEIENPKYYLELGKLHYHKSNIKRKGYKKAIQYLNKSIKLAEKYFVNLYGETELLLLKIKNSKKDKKVLFDKSIKDFIFYNSYQKDTRTTYFSQILYKYQSFSINALSSLSENYLYFATPEQLNDPFDVASESLEKQFYNLELDKSDFKLCSLSQINDNKLMWSHYTQEHTGISVGYKFLYLPNYVGKSEVKYKNTNLDENEVFDNIIEYWTVKSEDWEYEKEVRLLHYGQKQKIYYTFNINEAIEKNIIALEIESITFGLKFKNKDILKPIVSEIEKRQNRKINLFKAKISEQKLIIEKVNI